MARIPKAQNGKGLKCATNVGGCGSMNTPRGSRISKREQKALDKEYSTANPGYQYSGDRRYTINYRPERTDEKKVGKEIASANATAKKGAKVSKKNWIQGAVNPKHKGYCTPMTKKTCTPKRKALAVTFKHMAAKRKGK